MAEHFTIHEAETDREAALIRALERERQARKEAERTLEEKSLDLFLRQQSGSLGTDTNSSDTSVTHDGSTGVANTQLRKLSLVVKKVHVAVIITDARGRVEWVNDHFTRMTGYEPHEAIGQTPGLLLQGVDTDQATVRRMRDAMERGEAFQEEMLNYRKDGSPFWIAMNVTPVHNEAGQLVQWISINTDVTEERKSRDQLEAAKARAETANRAKDEFLANMSHEIRTPLTAILGYSEMLDLNEITDAHARRDALSAIRQNGKHLVTIINEILDLSKIEAGQLDVEKVRFSPKQLLEEIVGSMRGSARKKSLPLELDFVGAIPRTIETDPLRLRQILLNLLSNAIKFTEEGEVRVLVRLRHLASGSARLQIDVIDTGMGIQPEVMERIFDPFSQADSSTTRKFGGTGLGLAISVRLAKLLGGTIDVQSKPGHGSCFTIDVDAGRPDDAATNETAVQRLSESDIASYTEQTNPQTPAAPKAKVSTSGRRLLVVDDAPENQRLIEFKMKRSGFQVDVVADGQAGFQAAMKAMRDQNPYRCILLDMQMPVMDGYETARKLREQCYNYPIVALTANAMRGEREKCIDSGCDDYVAKPIDFNQLVDTVRNLEKESFDKI